MLAAAFAVVRTHITIAAPAGRLVLASGGRELLCLLRAADLSYPRHDLSHLLRRSAWRHHQHQAAQVHR
ncbi:hypothetical protein [Streptomyces formicae]